MSVDAPSAGESDAQISEVDATPRQPLIRRVFGSLAARLGSSLTRRIVLLNLCLLYTSDAADE